MITTFFNFIERNPLNGATATAGLGTLGYAPNVLNKGAMIEIEWFDKLFQYSVWGVSIIVGLVTLYITVCKEHDRRKDRKNKLNKDDDE